MPNKAIISIVCITLLLGIALWKGVDGVLLSGGIAVIAGLGGFAIAKSKHDKGNGTKPPIPPVT